MGGSDLFPAATQSTSTPLTENVRGSTKLPQFIPEAVPITS